MNIDERWEKGIPHNPKSEDLYKKIKKIDNDNGGELDLRSGGDGDNGEHLMYIFDIIFDEKPKTKKRKRS